jgi:predicted transcriptional regulator of viral defense system
LGLFHLQDAKRAGVPQQTLSRLVADGEITRVDQDLYRHPDADIDPETEDYAIACAKFGTKSAIGGLTALFHYHLTDQAPQQIWIVVPPQKESKDNRYRCLRTKTSLDIGIERHPTFRIATVERAIAEGFRFATKIGLETALKAARAAFKDKLTTPDKVMKIARELGIENYVLKYWEAIIVP